MVAVGEDHALLNAGDERQSQDARGSLGEQGDGLAGVAEDVVRLGVGVGFLMEFLDGGILRPALGSLRPSPTRTGLQLTRRMAGWARKTSEHQARVRRCRSTAGLWKRSSRRS